MSDKKELQSRKMFNYVLEQMKQGTEWVKIDTIKKQPFNDAFKDDDGAFQGMLVNGKIKKIYKRKTYQVEKGKYQPAFIIDEEGACVTIPKWNLIDLAEAMPELK